VIEGVITLYRGVPQIELTGPGQVCIQPSGERRSREEDIGHPVGASAQLSLLPAESNLYRHGE
jgi:hypothetical protein